MKALHAVKTAAKRAGVPSTGIGPALGKTKAYIAANAYRGSTPKADNLAAMLNVCGYELCAVPRKDVPPSAIIIDGSVDGAREA